MKAEFASGGAPQSACVLWPVWPDIRAVRSVRAAPARRWYARYGHYKWVVAQVCGWPAPYLPRGLENASENRKNVVCSVCWMFHGRGVAAAVLGRDMRKLAKILA